MTDFAGIFEVLASDQHDARVASRKALVLSRDRIDARLGKFLGASRSSEEFDARYDLVSEDFEGIVRIAAEEVGHGDPDALVETLRAHYADKEHWIQDEVKKPGDLHKKLHVPEGEKIPEEKIENAEDNGDKNLKEKAQFAENVKKGSTVADYLSSYYASDDEDEESKPEPRARQDAWTDYGSDPGPNDDEDEDKDKKAKISKKGKKCAECKDKNHDSCAGGDCSCKKCSDDDDDDSLEFAAKTADAVPFVHTADGNTGLAGPSPKMDKKRWTPKSVKPIDVPSERHPTVQKDITEIMPKKNEGPPGDAQNIDEIWALTTTETLPTGKGLDDAGFADNNQDMAPHTKTFGDGGQVAPVKSESLEA